MFFFLATHTHILLRTGLKIDILSLDAWSANLDSVRCFLRDFATYSCENLKSFRDDMDKEGGKLDVDCLRKKLAF